MRITVSRDRCYCAAKVAEEVINRLLLPNEAGFATLQDGATSNDRSFAEVCAKLAVSRKALPNRVKARFSGTLFRHNRRGWVLNAVVRPIREQVKSTMGPRCDSDSTAAITEQSHQRLHFSPHRDSHLNVSDRPGEGELMRMTVGDGG